MKYHIISEKDNHFPWLQITSLDQCNEAHQKFKNHINDVIFVRYAHIMQNHDASIIEEDFAQYEFYLQQFVYREGLI